MTPDPRAGIGLDKSRSACESLGMHRRVFLRTAAVLPLTLAASCLPAYAAPTLLAPLIEVGEPLRSFPESLDAAVSAALEACEAREAEWPGFSRALYRGLGDRLWPLTTAEVFARETRPTFEQRVEQALANLSLYDDVCPGVRAAVCERLVQAQHGVTLSELLRVAETRWPWRHAPGFDAWSHHGYALSEAGKP